MPLAIVARVVDTQANQSFEASFERFPVRVGRNQLNDLHIDRPYVSQFHAAIDLRDGRIWVKDLGSTNGTVFAGERMVRDAPVDVSPTPEIRVGPVVIHLGLVEATPRKAARAEGALLDAATESRLASLMGRPAIPPGAEDPYVRQLQPYVDAYRGAWAAVYHVVYDTLARLPAELRMSYVRRVAAEHPALAGECDFQKIARYYGVDPTTLGAVEPRDVAFAAMCELARTLAPGSSPLTDTQAVLAFARRLRDCLDVFLKCFVSLRDGYQEFEAEVLARDRGGQTDKVASAKDSKQLGMVLLDASGGPDAARQLHEIFVDVMSHQVALLSGVMEGVRTLLTQLAPETLEHELERKGKKVGLFSNKYEALWKLYGIRHGDYSGEDKETFSIIFGPQFSRAYAATAGEDYQASGEATGKATRFSLAGSGQLKR